MIGVVECAIEHKGRLLIIERSQGVHAEGLLAFPGGEVEISDGDDGADVLLEAVKREVFEEVGLQLNVPIHYLTSCLFSDGRTGGYVLDVIFHCELETVPNELNVSEREVPRYMWLAPEEILQEPNSPKWLSPT